MTTQTEETVQERFWRLRAAANHEALLKADLEHVKRIEDLKRQLADAKAAAQKKHDELLDERAYTGGLMFDQSKEIEQLKAERDAALAVIDMVNRSANAWVKGCDRAERTIARLKARISRLKLRGRAAA